MDTISDPEVAFVPDQDPEAVQAVASFDDQVKVIGWPTSIFSEDDWKKIVGINLAINPVPTPPSHEATKIKIIKSELIFFTVGLLPYQSNVARIAKCLNELF